MKNRSIRLSLLALVIVSPRAWPAPEVSREPVAAGRAAPAPVAALAAVRDGLILSLQRSGLPGVSTSIEQLKTADLAQPAAFSDRVAAVAAAVHRTALDQSAPVAEVAKAVSVLADIDGVAAGVLTAGQAEAVRVLFTEAVRTRSARIAADIEKTVAAMGTARADDGAVYPDVMARLKEQTKDLHAQAERHPFQRGLLKTRRADYESWLGQMLLVHSALEPRLRALGPSVPALARVVKDHQFQQANLSADLAHFGVDEAKVRGLPAAQDFAALVERAAADAVHGPYFLLGMHYVLEGSKNGAYYISKLVRLFLHLSPGAGDRYLNPYGARQKERWAEFKADMIAAGLTPEQQSAVAAGANAMYLSALRLNDDLLSRKSSPGEGPAAPPAPQAPQGGRPSSGLARYAAAAAGLASALTAAMTLLGMALVSPQLGIGAAAFVLPLLAYARAFGGKQGALRRLGVFAAAYPLVGGVIAFVLLEGQFPHALPGLVLGLSGLYLGGAALLAAWRTAASASGRPLRYALAVLCAAFALVAGYAGGVVYFISFFTT